jgi:hypothetical protein
VLRLTCVCINMYGILGPCAILVKTLYVIEYSRLWWSQSGDENKIKNDER